MSRVKVLEADVMKVRQRAQDTLESEKQRDSLVDQSLTQQLKQNIRIQTELLSGARAYQEFLKIQAKQVLKSEEQLIRRFDVAFNTFETVKLSSTHLSLIEEGLKDLSNLQALQVRQLINLNEERMIGHLEFVRRHLAGEVAAEHLQR